MSTASSTATPRTEAPTLTADDCPRTFGRYVLLRRIARGGMGEVFLATTTGLEGAERPTVVKIIRREHAKDPSFIARFLDEARVQAQLVHSGVAQVLEAAVEETMGEPFAAIEHVEGRSLGDVRARAIQLGERIGWSEAVAVAALVAEALAHVHERQDVAGRPLAIVHRDLSPQNVMLSYAGDAKIIDFGTARGQNRRCHTVAGVVFAKPGYVAPEVANGDPGDCRVDLYALGIMLWELCAGQRFLQGDAADHLAAVARNESSPPPVAASVGAPADLDEIVARLTAFDRDARYGEGRLCARDLARLLTPAPALPTGERGVRARVAALMQRLFPSEPARSRREFARLVIAARAAGLLGTPSPSSPSARSASASSPTDATNPAPQAKPPASARDQGELDRLPGTRYRLGRELGRGATSVVYEAEHVDLGRRVALKVIGEGGSPRPAYAARLRTEARALCRLRHPGLTELFDVGVSSDGRLFCAMELLEGETLEAHLTRSEVMGSREVLMIALGVLHALEVAHGAGLVHRDIKPANLFLTSSGGVKILDFGLAKEVSLKPAEGGTTDRRDADEHEGEGVTLFGTPEYMAPEQAAGGRLDGRADLYALGCVLYEMLTSRLPFVGPSPLAILDAKTKGSPEHPRERTPARRIPGHVDELVMRAIARHPSVRFQTALEMRIAVERALEAPERSRAGRRALGFAALAASMGFAGVLLLGAVPNARSVVPWLSSLVHGGPSRDASAEAPVPEAPAEAAPAAPVEPDQEALATGDAADDDALLMQDQDEEEDVAPVAAVEGAPADENAVRPDADPSAEAKSVAPKPRRRTGDHRTRTHADAKRTAPEPRVIARAASADTKHASADRATGDREAAPPTKPKPEPVVEASVPTAPSDPAVDAAPASTESTTATSGDALPTVPVPALEAKRAGPSKPAKDAPKTDGRSQVRRKKKARVAHKPE